MCRGKHLSVLLFLVAIVLVGTLTQGCVTSGQYNRLKEQLARANETIDLKDQRIEELDHEVMVKQEECLALKDNLKDVDRFRKNSEEAAKIISDLKAQLASSNEKLAEGSAPEGVEFWVPKGNNVGIRLQDKVLFDSGSTTIKPVGKEVLNAIAMDLKSRQKKIRILGHTDTDPVVKTKNKYPKGNIQLSAERAIAVWQYFKTRGVPEKLMSVEGYGPSVPLDSNSTTQGKQRNRRVEIILTD